MRVAVEMQVPHVIRLLEQLLVRYEARTLLLKFDQTLLLNALLRRFGNYWLITVYRKLTLYVKKHWPKQSENTERK